jgi:hypothetical protein
MYKVQKFGGGFHVFSKTIGILLTQIFHCYHCVTFDLLPYFILCKSFEFFKFRKEIFFGFQKITKKLSRKIVCKGQEIFCSS